MDVNYFVFRLELPLWVPLCSSFILSFVITLISIPTVVKVSGIKKLYDFPNIRDSHKTTIPVLGGISIFAAFVISIVLFSAPGDSSIIRYLSGALVVLFFTGLMDDILILDPKKKLISQILAALIIVVPGEVRITYLYNILSIGDVSYVPGLLISMLLIITLINGFNLIDGVDGLSSGIGIFSSILFGILFVTAGDITYAVMAFSISGALISFFIFNVFGKENKIFMGDTGAMITGMIIALFTIRYLEIEKASLIESSSFSPPVLVFGLLIVPLFDTLRIFIIRILNGKSPFMADRNHIHHNLLKLGLSHLQVTVFLIVVTIFFLLIGFIIQNVGPLFAILSMILIAGGLALWLDIYLRTRARK